MSLILGILNDLGIQRWVAIRIRLVIPQKGNRLYRSIDNRNLKVPIFLSEDIFEVIDE